MLNTTPTGLKKMTAKYYKYLSYELGITVPLKYDDPCHYEPAEDENGELYMNHYDLLHFSQEDEESLVEISEDEYFDLVLELFGEIPTFT